MMKTLHQEIEFVRNFFSLVSFFLGKGRTLFNENSFDDEMCHLCLFSRREGREICRRLFSLFSKGDTHTYFFSLLFTTFGCDFLSLSLSYFFHQIECMIHSPIVIWNFKRTDMSLVYILCAHWFLSYSLFKTILLNTSSLKLVCL